ncbi:phage integrase N-terminal SAM-like domain-containing protein [Vibrio ezurae]
MEAIRTEIRLRYYSYQTEKPYLYWNCYFIRHCNIRHGADITTL